MKNNYNSESRQTGVDSLNILVIEDYEPLWKVYQHVFPNSKFTFSKAGKEGASFFVANHASLDLLLTDYELDDSFNGDKVIEFARLYEGLMQRSRKPIIFSSGYPLDFIEKAVGKKIECDYFIQKPADVTRLKDIAYKLVNFDRRDK